MGWIVKLLAVCFIFILATGSLVVTDSKKRSRSGRIRLTIGILILCIVLVFVILR